MIKNDLGKEIHISGHPVQIAAELEELARVVRESFRKMFGNKIGEALFEECIRKSKMSKEEAAEEDAEEVNAAKIQCPEEAELCEKFAGTLLESILEDNASPCSAKREGRKIDGNV